MMSSNELSIDGQKTSLEAIVVGYKGIRQSGTLNFLAMAINVMVMLRLAPAESPVRITFL